MNSLAIRHLKKVDNRLSCVIDFIGNITIHSYHNSFEFLVREIVGQMISNRVKKIILDRLYVLCSGEINPDSILSLSVEDIRHTGMSSSKVFYIQNLASIVKNGSINFDNLSEMDDRSVIRELTKIKGIGVWTSKMYLLFYLQREDVLPYEDGAFLQAYKWLYSARKLSPSTVIKKCRSWKPYSSYGARYLYVALDRGLTKREIKAFLSNEDEHYS